MASNSVVIRVRAVDKFAQYSGYLAGTFTNPAPSTPSGLTSSPWMNGLEWNWAANTELDLAYYLYRYQVESEGWTDWVRVTEPSRIFVFLDDTQNAAYPSGATISFELKAVDTFGNESGTATDNDVTGSLWIPPTAIDDFEQISGAFPGIPVLRNFTWQMVGSYIDWSAGSVWYNGAEYSITSGNTASHWVYWDPNGTTTIFVGTDDDSTIPRGSFIIAVNDGYVNLAWNNAVANQVIGSSWIRNAAIVTAKIDDLAVTSAKINDLAVITAKINDLAVTNAKINDLSASKINAGSMNASYITAGTLTATQINGSGFGTLTLSSGSIVIQTTYGLDVSGSVRLQAGADIDLIGNDSDPGKINFIGTSYTMTIGGNAAGTEFSFYPSGNNVITLNIGGDSWITGNLCKYTEIYAYVDAAMTAARSGTLFSSVFVETGTTYAYATLSCRYSSYVHTVRSYVSASDNYFGPTDHKVVNLARSSAAFDNAYADDWNNVADVPILDNYDDLQIIMNMKSSGIMDERTGFEILNDSSLDPILAVKYKKDTEERILFPKEIDEEEYRLLLIKYKKENGIDTDYKKIIRKQIEGMFIDWNPKGHWHWVLPGDRINIFKKGSPEYSPEGKPFISTRTHLGLHDGAFRQLTEEQQQIHSMIEQLNIRLIELEKSIA